MNPRQSMDVGGMSSQSRATYSEDHPSREDQAKGNDLKYDMYP